MDRLSDLAVTSQFLVAVPRTQTYSPRLQNLHYNDLVFASIKQHGTAQMGLIPCCGDSQVGLQAVECVRWPERALSSRLVFHSGGHNQCIFTSPDASEAFHSRFL